MQASPVSPGRVCYPPPASVVFRLCIKKTNKQKKTVTAVNVPLGYLIGHSTLTKHKYPRVVRVQVSNYRKNNLDTGYYAPFTFSFGFSYAHSPLKVSAIEHGALPSEGSERHHQRPK